MFKVVAVDSVRLVPTVEREILAEADAELFTADCHGEEDVIRATGDAHALLVSLSPITRRVIASWSRNRVVARYGIGVDTVDLQAATDHGIYVTNVPDFCYDEVSDTAMSLILAVTRKLVRMHSLVSRGVYNRKLAVPIYKARGQTLGAAGFRPHRPVGRQEGRSLRLPGPGPRSLPATRQPGRPAGGAGGAGGTAGTVGRAFHSRPR